LEFVGELWLLTLLYHAQPYVCSACVRASPFKSGAPPGPPPPPGV